MRVTLEVIETSDWGGMSGLLIKPLDMESAFELGSLMASLRNSNKCVTVRDGGCCLNIPIVPSTELNTVDINKIRSN
jgi:hypothetical protein